MRTIEPERIVQFNRKIGAYLKSQRITAGFTIPKVSNLTDIPYDRIIQYETGNASPPTYLFADLIELYKSDVLNVNLAINEAAAVLRIVG